MEKSSKYQTSQVLESKGEAHSHLLKRSQLHLDLHFDKIPQDNINLRIEVPFTMNMQSIHLAASETAFFSNSGKDSLASSSGTIDITR
jgi:hypothetical protein